MRENRKKPQNKNLIQPAPTVAPQKEISKPLDKVNYNDRKHPKGGCGCS